MSLNILADRRNALIFAGGVVACAALATSNMGSQYSPDTEEARAQSVASATTDRTSRASKATHQSTSVAYGSQNESVFGTYGEDEAGYEDNIAEDPDFGSDNAPEEAADVRPAKPVMRPATAQIRPVGPGAGSANPLQTVMDGETTLRSPTKGRKASGS